MSPKIIDKSVKRKEVALACADLIHEVGIKNLTVSEVAKTAGIGKGTIYEYFENKEDIIFEIINIHIETYHNEFLESIKDVNSTRDKVFHFFKFVIDNSEENMKHFKGYKEYLSIVLSDDNENMLEYNESCNIFFTQQIKKVIQEGIDKGELIPAAMNLSDGLLIFEKGLCLLKMTQKDAQIKYDCEIFINNIFDLIEIKNDK